jgi:nitrate/nitrite-specific signal transduction histidine kinase
VRATLGGHERRLDVHVTPVLSRRGTLLGRTLLVRDVTALRRAEALALEHERALAALQERERVARELHDGLAQVLGFVRLQAEAARGMLRRDAATAEAYLSRLAEAALEAHGEVRSFIAGSARAPASASWPRSPRRCGASARRRDSRSSSVDRGLDDDALAQPVAAHLLRIVQEALHNVRKHARASRVTVTVEADDAWVQVVVADDGVGLADRRSDTEFRLRDALHARARRGRGRVARDRVRPRRRHAGDGARATP